MNALFYGTLYGLLASIFLTTQGVSVRMSTSFASTPFQVFTRFLVCFVLSFLLMAFQMRGKFEWKVTNGFILLTRGLAAFGALASVFYSIRYFNTGIVYVLYLSAPLFIPLVAKLWLGSKLYHRFWFGMVMAMIGIYLIIDPSPVDFHPRLLFPVLAALLAAYAKVAVRVLQKTESNAMIKLAYFLMATIGSLFWFGFSSEPAMTRYDEWYLLLFAGISGFLYQTFMIKGLNYLPARIFAPMLYMSSIFSFLIDGFFFGLIPSEMAVLGVVLVIGGTLLNVFLFSRGKFEGVE